MSNKYKNKYKNKYNSNQEKVDRTKDEYPAIVTDDLVAEGVDGVVEDAVVEAVPAEVVEDSTPIEWPDPVRKPDPIELPDPVRDLEPKPIADEKQKDIQVIGKFKVTSVRAHAFIEPNVHTRPITAVVRGNLLRLFAKDLETGWCEVEVLNRRQEKVHAFVELIRGKVIS